MLYHRSRVILELFLPYYAATEFISMSDFVLLRYNILTPNSLDFANRLTVIFLEAILIKSRIISPFSGFSPPDGRRVSMLVDYILLYSLTIVYRATRSTADLTLDMFLSRLKRIGRPVTVVALQEIRDIRLHLPILNNVGLISFEAQNLEFGPEPDTV